MRSIQLLTLSVIFALTGCLSLAPDYQRPVAPVPQQFSLSQNRLVAATAGYQETGWRTFFVDPQVKSLISTALTNTAIYGCDAESAGSPRPVPGDRRRPLPTA
ncbi:copper/silver efflux system outer membrane protein CusC [Klebsiella pneumoniae]|uniref:Copper/silver efflux system outer membrane protein CusC n=1 Tax=Klebsiella pneumoniae TaxID=573 RepID=A0A377UW26_KLEPN|nr:copper/silver efflux system outer membrane protein CusC [Klebsiella pneumoniae]